MRNSDMLLIIFVILGILIILYPSGTFVIGLAEVVIGILGLIYHRFFKKR